MYTDTVEFSSILNVNERRGVVTRWVCVYKCQSTTVTLTGWRHRYNALLYGNYVINRECPGCTENTRRTTSGQVAKDVLCKELNAMSKN